MSRVIGAVLAAGSGSRMGAPKAQLRVGAARLVDRAVTVLRGAGCADVIAVTRRGVQVPGARVVVNVDPERGLRSSLQLALEAAEPVGDALAVLLVDLPGVQAGAARTVIEAWRPGRISVASYGGRRGHPIVMSPRLWREAVARADADAGARAFLVARSELVDEVPVAGDPLDLDTPADLARWLARATTVRLEVLVRGRVQGVGLRYWVRERARELELRGTATNLADGRVAIAVEGARYCCDALLVQLSGTDTPGAVVDVVATWSDPQGEPAGFRVR